MTDHPNLSAALAAFQAQLPTVVKGDVAQVKSDKASYSYRYVDLADLARAVLPALGKEGLSFTASPTLDDRGVFVLAYSLRHASGESIDGRYPLPSANQPAQQLGSAITYARRYALLAVTGVAAGDDDDGASAPPASSRPAERHEASWDPAEQEMLRDGWMAEIAAADNDALTSIGKSIGRAKRDGELSPATYDLLIRAGAARKAELAAS